jgi:hypothetical protein
MTHSKTVKARHLAWPSLIFTSQTTKTFAIDLDNAGSGVPAPPVPVQDRVNHPGLHDPAPE